MFKGERNNYKIIGICCAGIQTEGVRDIVMSISRKAAEHGYRVLLFTAFTDMYYDSVFTRGEESIYRLINPKLLDALVVLPISIKNDRVTESIISAAKSENIPVISVDERIDGCFNLMFDYVDTFEEIVRHVIEHHKCKTVNFIAGMRNNEFSDSRIECFKKVIAENGIEFDERRFGYGDFWEGPTVKVMNDFLSSGLPMPEAIICCNDAMAITACRILRENGYSVPKDVIVTGFDGIELEKYTTPRLTTSSADIGSMGEVALDAIEKLTRGEKVPDMVEIPFHMVVSQSCGCVSFNSQEISDKILDLYRRISNSEGHENLMFSYLAKTVECNTLNGMGRIMSNYADVHSWCCVNMDFLEQTPQEERYNEKFTNEMFTLMKCSNGEFSNGMIFPASQLLPDFEEALEKNMYLMFVPIHYQDEVIGYEAVAINTEDFNFQNTHRFLSNTNQIMENFKNRICLEQAYAEMAEMHMKDPMTGIYNRRGFYNYAEKLIRKCNKNGKNAVLFSVDMDGLKNINDTYGHNEGDRAIKIISDSLTECSNHGEICSRFGGDEFIVMAAADNSQKYFKDFTDRVEQSIERLRSESGLEYSIRISCGAVSVDCSSVDELDEFIRMADLKMYEQKRRHKLSRNNVQ